MSKEQLKAFLEKVKGDTSLQEKLKSAANWRAVVTIAKEKGFSISADDLTKAQSELSEKELEDVAGGGPGGQLGCGFGWTLQNLNTKELPADLKSFADFIEGK